jgi:hypothetical protein
VYATRCTHITWRIHPKVHTAKMRCAQNKNTVFTTYVHLVLHPMYIRMHPTYTLHTQLTPAVHPFPKIENGLDLRVHNGCSRKGTRHIHVKYTRKCTGCTILKTRCARNEYLRCTPDFTPLIHRPYYPTSVTLFTPYEHPKYNRGTSS